jgi:hypothetical protein
MGPLKPCSFNVLGPAPFAHPAAMGVSQNTQAAPVQCRGAAVGGIDLQFLAQAGVEWNRGWRVKVAAYGLKCLSAFRYLRIAASLPTWHFFPLGCS